MNGDLTFLRVVEAVSLPAGSAGGHRYLATVWRATSKKRFDERFRARRTSQEILQLMEPHSVRDHM